MDTKEDVHYGATDDDGHPRRIGTFWTASAHIITTVVGSGVLSLPWAIAQLGWVAGPIALLLFSIITMFPDAVTGKRNYTYTEVVQANLGGRNILFSGIAQYGNLVGFTVGYTITTATSMVAVKRSQCFHKHGHNAGCHMSKDLSIIIFGLIQIIMSQIPNIHELSWLSLLTTLMCFSHASIGLALSISKVAGGVHAKTSLTGVPIGKDLSTTDKLLNILTALGNLAFAYGFSDVLIEIQDTLRSKPPENKVMKQASFAGISISTFFYLSCGLSGYAAFGNNAPGNLLAGFGFFEPFWLIDLANIFVIVHLIGAYQICGQPIFGFVEKWIKMKRPNCSLNKEFNLGRFKFTILRIVWRTAYVMFTTVLSMMFPFFNDIVGFLGAVSFWPLTVYFPFKIHIEQKKIDKCSLRWILMQILSAVCLVTSMAAAVGSIGGIIRSLQAYKIFHSVS